MDDSTFIYETSGNQIQRICALLFLMFLLVFGAGLIIANLTGHTFMGYTLPKVYITDLVSDITIPKLFFITFLGYLIFFPLPTEIAFYFALAQGNDPLLSTIVASIGVFLGNAVNYYIGYKLTNQVMYLLSAKNFFKVRRQVNKWGAYAIFFMNVIPSPSDILGVGLGTIKYSKTRFLLISGVATLIKFAVIAFIVSRAQGGV
jgi:membrane protein YqaA with SNARE-associated domain